MQIMQIMENFMTFYYNKFINSIKHIVIDNNYIIYFIKLIISCNISIQ